MATYLLIEFDEKKTAHVLLKKIYQATKRGRKYRIVGLFETPSGPFCQHTIAETRWRYDLVRGEKTGWRYHTECKLPRRESIIPRNLWPDMLDKKRRQRLSASAAMADDGHILTISKDDLSVHKDGSLGPLKNFPVRLPRPDAVRRSSSG